MILRKSKVNSGKPKLRIENRGFFYYAEISKRKGDETMKQTSDTRYPGRRIRRARRSIPFSDGLHDFTDDANAVHFLAGEETRFVVRVKGD